MHFEKTNGVKKNYGRNGREYRLLELPRISVNGYCHETNTIYEFLGYFWH